MSYQEVLQIIDFSTLFQLAFTLYAAFIVVEYAKSFTSYVINRFYSFKEEIADSIQDSKKLCRQEEMQSIDSDDYFKSGDGLCFVTEYNAFVKACEEMAESTKENLNKYVDKNTEYRIFRHISLFMVLFSFTFLFAGGVFSLSPSETVHFLLSFTAFSLLIIIAGWISSATHVIQAWSEKRSLVIVVVLYILAVAVGILSLRIHPSWNPQVEASLCNWGIILAVLLPYLNFVFFFLLITIQIRKIKKHCKEASAPYVLKCKAAGELMEKILIHQEMINKAKESKLQEETEKEA